MGQLYFGVLEAERLACALLNYLTLPVLPSYLTLPCSVSQFRHTKVTPYLKRQAIGARSTKLQCVTHSPLCSAHSEPR